MKRPFLITVGSVGVFALFFLVWVLLQSRPEWTLLLRSENAELNRSMIEMLDERGETYEVHADGIFVPKSRLDDLVIEAEAVVYYHSAVHSGSFDERMELVREKKLERMILRMEMVRAVEVMVGRERAAVTLDLHGGRELSGDVVRIIAGLVATAVKGVRPSDVQVSDTTGRLYATGK